MIENMLAREGDETYSWLKLTSYQRTTDAGDFADVPHVAVGSEGEAYWYDSGRGYSVLVWEDASVSAGLTYRFHLIEPGGWHVEVDRTDGIHINLLAESEFYSFEVL